LRSGASTNGTVINEDDDRGSGYNSRINRTLSAGTCMVEATTYASATEGTFSIFVTRN